MTKVPDEPVEPSPDAIQARQAAAAAAKEAEEHRQQALAKLAESALEMERLIDHRRANRFAELFAAALRRHQQGG